MANIMLTERCNLRCSYCFANEYVNHDPKEITIENFRKAISFIRGGGDCVVGLIGGEPTLHPQFRQILQELIRNDEIRGVSVFTNGILLDIFAEELSHEKFTVLVNCNAPEMIGSKFFERMVQNLELLIGTYGMKEQITLGVNIYKTGFQYDYLLKILRKFDFRDVRMSLTVPNTSDGRACDFEKFFQEMKPTLIAFLSDMLAAGIVPHYDCNKMPVCMFAQEEKKAGVDMVNTLPRNRLRFRGHSGDSSILSENAGCSPVVDILPDLTAVRCFGLSEHTRIPICDFRSVQDLRNYYREEFDFYGSKVYSKESCRDCYLRKTHRCTAGCLAYHIPKILALRSATASAAERIFQNENP